MRFEGKVALVTGGGSGIDLATVERFVQEGARVAIGDVDKTRLDRAQETFLASDEAGFMTGGLHLIDGGAATKRYPDVLGRVTGAAPRP